MMKRLYLSLFGLLLLMPAVAAASTAEGVKLGFDDPAKGWDHLWREVLIDITIIGLVFAAITIYFMVRYRRKSPDQHGSAKRLTTMGIIGWALIPTFAFVADDFYLALKGWDLWNDYRTPPAERIEVDMTASLWSWNFTYPGGVESTDNLVVPEGMPVLMRMTSEDVLHALFLPDHKVKEDAMPGRITYYWFYPKKEGKYIMSCTEYCGRGHSSMGGSLRIISPERYETIMASQKAFDAWLDPIVDAEDAAAEAAANNKGGA